MASESAKIQKFKTSSNFDPYKLQVKHLGEKGARQSANFHPIQTLELMS